MLTEPIRICSPNLSHAWAQSFLTVMQLPADEVAPLVVSIHSLEDGVREDLAIREALDETLKELDYRAHRLYTCDQTALTIFPFSYWKRHFPLPATELFRWYLEDLLPRLKARDSRNSHGTYFERMIAFTGLRKTRDKFEFKVVNQLEHIILDWHRPRTRPKRPRQSALQVACFDPAKDHTGQSVRGFPCLQQVSFTYDQSGGLTIHAYYPTQYIFDRAYGNYLGLCQLGLFMAHELGLRLSRFNCYIGHPELGSANKSQLRLLAKRLTSTLAPL
jgi:hypothetical protein